MQITPRLLKGFRDFLPTDESRRRGFVRVLEDSFRTFGFVPIDTPILEYAEVLLGKGGGETDKQVYRFQDHGKRDVAMRFDLTVPFARYMALHKNELYLPFKRYHIDKVFRGENTQRGRYREFTQCDFDIVGTHSISADLEIISVIDSAFRALGVPQIQIHISHRALLNRYLETLGVADRGETVLRAIDKLRKVGREKTIATLASEVGAETATSLIEFVEVTGDYHSVLAHVESRVGADLAEVKDLRQIGEAIDGLGLSGTVRLDTSITRGLDYYTGVVYETFLRGAEGIGSVCSGGRYDDLVSIYSSETMPGVGASIGLDRLLAALEQLDVVRTPSSSADLLIAMQDVDLLGHYHVLAKEFRAAGFSTEVYPDGKKLGQQFAFAERKGIPFVVVCGHEEYKTGTVNLRRIDDRRQFDALSVSDALKQLRRSRQANAGAGDT